MLLVRLTYRRSVRLTSCWSVSRLTCRRSVSSLTCRCPVRITELETDVSNQQPERPARFLAAVEALRTWVAELHEALLGEPFLVRPAADMEAQLDKYKVGGVLVEVQGRGVRQLSIVRFPIPVCKWEI